LGRGRVREGGEEREVTGESGSEREREWYFLFKWLWGPDDQIMEIETSRPESPGHWPEYPGVTDGISRNVERNETHRQLVQRLALASGNVYDAKCPACTSIAEKRQDH